MIINIRYKTFETNSSSIHTIVFHKTDFSNVIDDTYMEIHGGSYTRCPEPPLTDIKERLNYLWTGLWDLHTSYKHENNEWITIVDKKGLQWWKDAIHMYCPNAVLYDIREEDWYGVDHADELTPLFCAMKTDISILKDFLLDPLGKIYVSGDEYEDSEEPFDRSEIPWVDEYEKLISYNDGIYVYVKGN